MYKTKIALLVFGVTASVWACGGDDDDTGGGSGGKGGKGGSAGSSTAGKGGNAGTNATGGKGGTGGTGGATGGSAGKGASGGTGGSAGGPTGGTAGTNQGGSSGTAGAGGEPTNGGQGGIGAGGEGGTPSLTPLQQACDEICATQAGAACAVSTCVNDCNNLATIAAAPTEYEAMILCEADQNLTTANYDDYCPSYDPLGGILYPVATTPCEDEICTFTCTDASLVNADVYGRCGC